ncbi:isoprenylcysteine carboxylmethyltransferase family protein [Pararhizobium sp. A13]|uniref:methyltransferase family protein n=1 Tax=Pararhizobium sp. A13 TaxID=3133975 RepID=UPI00324777A1
MYSASQPAPFNQKIRLYALWLLAAAFLSAFLVSMPLWGEGSSIHEPMEVTGLVLLFTAILGRLWSILYIGSHKNSRLITDGPYSISRNPLYLFSLIGVTGIGLMFGSLLITTALVGVAFLIFHGTARREAAHLRGKFADAYGAYAADTPLLWPNFSRYRSETEVTFSTAALATTFRDAICLVALFPAVEVLEKLHAAGYLATLFYVP